MMTRSCLVIFLSLLFVTVSNAEVKKPSLEETMKAQLEESMKLICTDQAVLSCLGLSQQRCNSAVQSALKKCDPLFPKNAKTENAMDAHDQCMEQALPALFGVPADKINGCMGTTRNDQPTDLKQAILMASQQVSQALQRQAQQLATDGVTLPIYKKAKLMSHIVGEENLQSIAKIYGTKPLPAVMLATQDTLSEVAKYYRKQLPHFREYKLHNSILFLEKGPEDFSMGRNMKLYVSTPHVMIVKDTHDPKAPQGTRSKIDIAYRK